MKLVYLVFATNSAYVEVLEKLPDGVEVDVAGGTWRWRHSPLHYMPVKIGAGRYVERGSRWGVIGVYDIENLKHVCSMVHDAVESQRDYTDAN